MAGGVGAPIPRPSSRPRGRQPMVLVLKCMEEVPVNQLRDLLETLSSVVGGQRGELRVWQAKRGAWQAEGG